MVDYRINHLKIGSVLTAFLYAFVYMEKVLWKVKITWSIGLNDFTSCCWYKYNWKLIWSDFISYLAAPRSNLDHCQEDILFNLMIITSHLLIQSEGYWSPREEVGSQISAETISRFWTVAIRLWEIHTIPPCYSLKCFFSSLGSIWQEFAFRHDGFLALRIWSYFYIKHLLCY